jgi:hypothetical protein
LSLLISFHKPLGQQWQSWCKASWGIFYHAETLQIEIKCDLACWLLPVALKRRSRYAQEGMKWTKILNMPHVDVFFQFLLWSVTMSKSAKIFLYSSFMCIILPWTKLTKHLLLRFCSSCAILH